MVKLSPSLTTESCCDTSGEGGVPIREKDDKDFTFTPECINEA